MSFDSRKRKRWADKSGVSEIIGNILILLITVTLFSTIIAFVQQMPVPEQVTRADFSAKLTFSGDGKSADLTLTHSGGDKLLKEDILVFVTIDSVNYPYYLSNDPDFVGSTWSTGGSWTKHLFPTNFTSKIEASVVDLAKQNTVWSSQISGGSGYSPPVIIERYVDSNQWTPTPDPVLAHQNFTLFVRITDPDNDLDPSKVWIDARQLFGIAQRLPDEQPVDGVFKWYFNTFDDPNVAPGKRYMTADMIDGAVIPIHAEDFAGHVANSAYVLSITILPVTPIKYTFPGEPEGSSGLPKYLQNISGRQGFGIFGENKTGGVARGTANTTEPRTVFMKDEKIFVRFASLDMNAMLGNNLTLLDERTNVYYTPIFWPGSTAAAPFYKYGSGSSYVYEAQFDTFGLPPGLYSLGMSLSNNPSASPTECPFVGSAPISIRQPGSTIWFEPSLWLFQDSLRTQLWGTRGSPFEVSGASCRIYGSLNVMDAQTTPAPTIEEIRIQDLSGVAQLYGRPVAGEMLKAWTPSGNMTAYNFEIDLRYANGGQWVGGSNSYTLMITRMADLNEGFYSLTTQVYIKANSAHADFFMGTSGIAVGHANFDIKDYALYVENNNFFTLNSLWGYTNTPSDRTKYVTTAMALGDLNGDGYKDLLVAQDSDATGTPPKNLMYFRNTLDTYGRWQDGSIMPRPGSDATNDIRWIAIGDINGDALNDFAYVSAANKIVIYNNTYGMEPKVFMSSATVVRKIDLKDMNGDGRADLIMLQQGKIVIYNLALWRPGGPSNITITKFPYTTTAWTGGSGILDFDIADMNGDGKLDILTVGDAGTISGSYPDCRGVWINNYTANPAPTPTVLDTAYFRLASGTQLGAGSVSTTHAKDGAALQFVENATGDNAGRVNVTMRFNPLATNDEAQTLVVTARTDSTEEVFYAWYSLDANGDSRNFVPMFQISSTAYQDYTFRLPTNVAGKAMFLRFTDGLNTLGSSQDSIFIDYVAVLSNQFGSYVDQRTNVVPLATAGWTCVRAANINGPSDTTPDVIAAKNGKWSAFHPVLSSGVIWDSGATATSHYVTSTDALMANTAPTLFDVCDINGDGYDDILVTNYTAAQSAITQVGFFMNMHNNALVWYRVSELGRSGGSGAITVTLAVNLFGRS